MTPRSHHRRLGLMMWGAIGVAFIVLAMTAVLNLGPRMSAYTVGVLVLICLAVCGATFWLDTRTARATHRLVDQLRHRPSR